MQEGREEQAGGQSLSFGNGAVHIKLLSYSTTQTSVFNQTAVPLLAPQCKLLLGETQREGLVIQLEVLC